MHPEAEKAFYFRRMRFLAPHPRCWFSFMEKMLQMYWMERSKRVWLCFVANVSIMLCGFALSLGFM